VWGTTFAIVQRALADASPTAFVVARFSLVSIVFLAFSRDARLGAKLLFVAKTPAERAFRRNVLVLGVTIGVGYILQTVGLLTTTTSKSAFLTSTAVIWTPLISILTGREKLTLKLGIAVLCTFAGIFFMTHPFEGKGVSLGDFLTLSCAAVFGVYIVWVDKALHTAAKITGDDHSAALMVASTQLVAASVIMIGFLPVMGQEYFTLTPYSVGALAFTALICTGATSYLQARYQNVVTPATAAVIYMLEPVVAMLIAEFLLTEQIGFPEVLGAGLIILGVIIAQVRTSMRFEI
jgi:drug/metabolite transporter (DMT)-like permease